MAERYEKKDEDADGLQTLTRGHTFMAYNIMADGTDHDDEKEEDFFQ